jgi:pimeloyl-ACP methyl ester carboxylesterase
VLSDELTTKARQLGVRHTATISGVESVYYEYPSHGTSGETVVMIHGYRGNHRGLEAITGGLGNYRVLMPDLPGFGQSEALTDVHDLDAYANWLEQFLIAVGVNNTSHVVGHSFGSLVVGLYSSMNSSKSVTLINPVSAPALSGPRAFLTKITSAFYHLSRSLPESLASWLLRSPIAVMAMSSVMAKTADRSLRRWIHKQHLDNFSDFASVKVAAEAYDASISTDLSKLAPSITSPVLIIAAVLDDITSIQVQRDVAKTYPNATIVEIQNVGHLVHYEAPAEAAMHISAFVESNK